MKKILFFLFFITASNFGQQNISPILIEHNTLVSDTSQLEIISYRIPYKNLLFIKNGEDYSTSFTLTLEFFKDTEFVSRQIVQPKFSLNSYKETLSGDKYFQDFVDVKLLPGKYILKPLLNLESTDLEYKIPEQNINVDSVKNNFQDPIIVFSNANSKNNEFILANFANKIPFAPQKYNILFGLKDTANAEIKASIEQFDKEIFTNTLKPISEGNFEISKNLNEIGINIKKIPGLKIYQISNFSHLLYEGPFELTIIIDTVKHKYSLSTIWPEKPKVLNNPEYAIRLLEYIEKEDVLGELLSSDDELYYKNLCEYWIDKFPADGMKYNYAMTEFYTRVDYAIENYSSLNSYDGAERDRGRIYILYGEPSNIERNYSEINEIMEIWTYEKIARKFIFKDVNGTGKFDLTN
ncbi:MAG: GWxTD domain-containing protein [Ignavibacteriales bacterium]|nr:GWxTD domain-containing protein [Ignavibacteriales bacterium]